VNTFLSPVSEELGDVVALARATEDEKRGQIDRLADFQSSHSDERPLALARLRDAALGDENVFAVLMEMVRSASLGEITNTLFEVGGTYRRNM